MRKNISSLTFFVVLAGVFAASAAHAGSASLRFSPFSGSYNKGENFAISVLVKSDIPVNAVQGIFTFPTNQLEVIRISKNNSIINLWVQEPSFSNSGEAGNVSFEGVALNPGFVGAAGKIVDVTFRVKNEGAAGLEFLKATILANDGLGTNVTSRNGGASFSLLGPKVAPEEKTSPQIVVLKEIQGISKESEGLLKFWEIMPYWVKISILAFVGAITIILSLTVLSFGLIVLIYLWKFALSHRVTILKKLAIWFKLAWHNTRRAVKTFLSWARIGEREVKGDIEYTIEQLRKDFKEATSSESPPFWQVVKDYWLSIGRIIKRFFVKNEKIRPSERKIDEGPD